MSEIKEAEPMEVQSHEGLFRLITCGRCEHFVFARTASECKQLMRKHIKTQHHSKMVLCARPGEYKAPE